MTQHDSTVDITNCANCGAALKTEFCGECGQSRDDLRRPFWSLATDTLDGLFSWDGRLLTTLRQLYTRPGKVARDYADGKRTSFTPPVRLYLIVSLVFFTAMTVSGVRIIAVDVSMTDTGPGINVEMFQPRGSNEPLRLSEEERADFIETGLEYGIARHWIDRAIYTAEHPREIEDKAAAAANQALILMVVVFILMNMALHPRTRIIDHIIHALYYHAAFLPVAGAVLIATVLIGPPTAVLFTLVTVGMLISLSALYLFDRGFYGSSWWGAILRALAMSAAYSIATGFLALGMIFLATM